MEFEPNTSSAVLYQLSYQATWELVILWVHNIPIDGEDTSEYMKDHIFNCGERRWYSHVT